MSTTAVFVMAGCCFAVAGVALWLLLRDEGSV